MPVVKPIPVGQNVSLIRGWTEQARSLEALRGQLGLAIVPGLQFTVPGSDGNPGSWFPFTSGPQVTQLVGSSGAVIVLFGASIVIGPSTYDHNRLGVVVDGGAANGGTDPIDHDFTAVSTNNTGNGSATGGGLNTITGLTAGWHLFTLAAQQEPGNPGTNVNSDPWLMVLAV